MASNNMDFSPMELPAAPLSWKKLVIFFPIFLVLFVPLLYKAMYVTTLLVVLSML